MSFTEQLSQALAIPVASLNPQSQGAGTALTPAVDMSRFKRIMAVIEIGAVASGGTLDFAFQASATSGGTYATISGASITQALVSNKTVTLELRADQVPAGKRFVKGLLTIGTAAIICSVTILGDASAYKPASQYDDATVTKTVT